MTCQAKRLTREGVETSIAEMYCALSCLPTDDPEDTQGVFAEAAAIERKLRARLDAQNRLDLAAPELLEAARLIWALHMEHGFLPPTALDALAGALRLAEG